VTQELTQAIVDLREDDALAMVDRLLADGADAVGILADCKAAMDIIGEKFANGEAFIPELIMAGEIMTGVSTKLKPHLAGTAPAETLGVVVIGTVQGDIHDIGKGIVVTMLDIAGFEVVDLGVDVPAAKVVEAVRENKAQVVGLSGLLTIAFDSMKATVAAVDEAGLRGDVKIMLGGAPVTGAVVEYTAADDWAKDAVAAVELAKSWVGGAS
jgi:methanogenic corrinoid protein MtbC1